MTVQRLCSKTACGRAASCTLTYNYADSTVVLGPLARAAEPHSYDLCADHAERMTAPRGWELVRLGDFSEPPPDELVALADAVRSEPALDPRVVVADASAAELLARVRRADAAGRPAHLSVVPPVREQHEPHPTAQDGPADA